MPPVSASTCRTSLIVAAAFFMLFMDSAIINTSLPQMARAFHVQPAEMSLGITIYILTTATFVPLSGWIAERWGARNVLAGAIAVFTLASLACAVSANLTQFAVSRACQGVGAALMTPVGRMIVLRNAEKSELVEALSLITWPALIGPVIGPALGGFITTYASWRWNFLLNLPLGALGCVLVLACVPDRRSPQRRPLDVVGFLLSAAALSCLIYGLESVSHAGAPWGALGLIVAGLALGGLSVWHFARHSHPLIELSALRIHSFRLSTVGAGALFQLAIGATPFLLPLLFQVDFKLSPVASGLMMLVYFVGNLGMKAITTPILRRFGFRKVLVGNGAAVGLSLLACALLDPRTPLPFVILILVAAGMVRSMQFTGLNTLAFADVSAEQQTNASTLMSMVFQTSVGLGVAASALILHLSQTWRGASGLEIVDFRVAFIVVGAVGLAAALWCLGLAPNAGAEVSGHGRARA